MIGVNLIPLKAGHNVARVEDLSTTLQDARVEDLCTALVSENLEGLRSLKNARVEDLCAAHFDR